MSLQYHLKIKEGDVAPYVLLPGDPKRVPIVASYWDEAHFVADNREHVTYTGVYKGVPISCTSTGMGCPSTACLLYTSFHIVSNRLLLYNRPSLFLPRPAEAAK